MERECPYSAKKSMSLCHPHALSRTLTKLSVYLDPAARGNIGWPVSTIIDGIPDIENITEALRTGPYGQCVYESDNDVCDHQVPTPLSPSGAPAADARAQVVNLEYSDGSTASFTMVAHTSLICNRQTRLHFSHGELVGDMSSFTVTDYRTRKVTKHYPRSEGGGHGGGDYGLMNAFVAAVEAGDQTILGTDIDEVLRSHMTVFASERSRREGRIVDCAEFEKEERAKLGL